MGDVTRFYQETQTDLIDFPVSDSFRDHFARQGLTYFSGRREPKPQTCLPIVLPAWTDDRPVSLAREIDGLKAQLAEVQAIVASQRAELEALRRVARHKPDMAYRGVDSDAVAQN